MIMSHENLSVFPFDVKCDEEIKGFVFEDTSVILGKKEGNYFIKNKIPLEM